MRFLSTTALWVGLVGVGALGAVAPAVAAPASGQLQTSQQKLFDAKTFTLANGLQVVVIENHRVPVVSQMVWYKVGAADEPAGKSGIAHLLEHLMFKGTETLKPKEFSRTVARHGGQDNAFTSSDYTAYYENIAAENLELVMTLEADRMRHLVLDKENVETERAVVYEERLTRTENEPSSLLSERLENALWVSHPYRNPVIGWPDELLALTREDALDFYRRWYAPNNAIVVISGDVTVPQVKALAEKIYGPLERGPEITRSRPTTLPPPAQVRVELHHAQVSQPTWRQMSIAPSYATAQDPAQVYALQVLSELLGGGATSRLYRALVIDHKLAAAAGSYYSPRAVDWGTFGLYFTPRPGADLAAGEAAMRAEIAKLLAQGVTDEEVEEAKMRLRAGVIYARDGLQGAANTLGMALATGGTLDQVEYWPSHIAEVSTAQVMEAARTVLGPDTASAVGVLLPEQTEQTAAPGEKP
jgi:zinc protease